MEVYSGYPGLAQRLASFDLYFWDLSIASPVNPGVASTPPG